MMQTNNNPSRRPRIIFFGTPDFAVPALQATCEVADVVAVITQPDKPVGRKKVLTSPPMKKAAEALHIPVLQPSTLKPEKPEGAECMQWIREQHIDCIVLVAYGKLLPQELLDIPPFGCVNIHPSLLPELRGPSPIHGAILQGLSHTGITIMLMDKGMDSGPILFQERYPLTGNETAPALHHALFSRGAELLKTLLPQYLSEEIQPVPQDETKATYCSLISREDGEITPETDLITLDRKLRAYLPWPGVYYYANGLRIKILEARVDIPNHTMHITSIQREGKSAQRFEEFSRQYPELIAPIASFNPTHA